MSSENQDMPKITGWFNLEITQNSTATGLVPGENCTKNMAIYEEITLDLCENLTCKGLAYHQSLELLANT